MVYTIRLLCKSASFRGEWPYVGMVEYGALEVVVVVVGV